MSVEQRRAVVDRQHSSLSMIRQCKLLGISRYTLLYRMKKYFGAEESGLLGEA